MKILLIDNGTKHLGKLKELLIGNDIDVCKLFSKYPPHEQYDLIVLSGGSQISVSAAPEIFKQEIDLIKNTKTPIIGICQGCEIVAHTFNSELAYLEHRTKRIKKIELLSNLFGLSQQIDVYEAHHFAIKKLGDELVELAKSNDGIEIFRHNNKQILGMQFHPEMFVDRTLGDTSSEKPSF